MAQYSMAQPGPVQICLSYPQSSWPHFHGALARVYKAAFFPQVPTVCRAAGNSSHTAGQVGLALGAMEPGKD